MKTRRAKKTISMAEARARLRAFELKQPGQLWPAVSLAGVIWPDSEFVIEDTVGVLDRLAVPWRWRWWSDACRGFQAGYKLVHLVEDD